MVFVGWLLVGGASLLIYGVITGNDPKDILEQVFSKGKITPDGTWHRSTYVAPADSSSSSGDASTTAETTSMSTARQTVMAYGNAQIGKMYQWAGTGPNTFDCSGLTMQAYRQIGITLPHSSIAQSVMGQATSNPQPGDIVYFGSPVHHVALWAGNNQILEAYDTGYPIRIAPMRTNEHYGYRNIIDSHSGGGTLV